jgi:hypothetical protein
MSNLLPDDVAASLPALYATQHEDDPIARVKFFTPHSSWIWYVTEFDPGERLCFGLVHGHDVSSATFPLMSWSRSRDRLDYRSNAISTGSRNRSRSANNLRRIRCSDTTPCVRVWGP